jgi:hypothetical protein
MEDGAIIKILESLSAELSEFRGEVSERFDALDGRLDITAARLDRQGGLLQTGSRHAVRQQAWSENVDKTLERLTKRIGKLEGKRAKAVGDEGPQQSQGEIFAFRMFLKANRDGVRSSGPLARHAELVCSTL